MSSPIPSENLSIMSDEKQLVGLNYTVDSKDYSYENRITSNQVYIETGEIERYINRTSFMKEDSKMYDSPFNETKNVMYTLSKYQEVKIIGKTDTNLYKVKYGDKLGYLEGNRKELFTSHVPYVIKEGSSNSSFKSYEPYTAITSTVSAQYKFLRGKSYTGNYGIRMVGNRYCVAVGSYYTTKIGTKLDIYLSSGQTIKCILGDAKSDRDTLSLKKQNINGSVVEFIVDSNCIDRRAKLLGSFNEIFKGDVASIKVYNN